MKKASKVAFIAKPLAIAAVMAGACASAQAQTNVTIYGRIDAGINYQSNFTQRDSTGAVVSRGGKWGVDGNEWGTSMFGFKGNEDLGGGLKAIFTLESGFDASNGQVNGGSGLWTRRSFVGLSGSAGTLKVGKDLAIQSDPIWALDPTGQQALSTATLVKERNWPQTNNMVSYESPSFGGFTATVMHGFGEAAGSFTKGVTPTTGPTNINNGSRDGISLAYVQPTYELRAIYDVQRDTNGQYSTLFASSKELTLGGTVTIDKLKLFAGYENLRAPSAAAGSPDRANHYWLGANYQITPALTLIGAAYHVNVNGGVGSANLFVLGGNYSLSKRTLLYATIGTIRNSSTSDFSVEYGTNGGAVGQNMNALYFGVSHSF
ncbi:MULTISPECIES: porin [unclassified Herbaspirillum]|uniref:porin n=1 Tax=unclassified Herbaspirillum TaxID=2624150 RepID=UPI000E2FA93C|nr:MULTISPECIES: porin [unclassified Herbaspirillum]RFB65765.1 porin [Herbaspirillum sp. 3R-3a1]TFI08930.1 porin [Herbaspirillum sp. 3R11]TFI15348.1 porin [Herbaspirillum sp. 3R-11]TFI24141.1 porin [Herbaspirillum sp. 3C11]